MKKVNSLILVFIIAVFMVFIVGCASKGTDKESGSDGIKLVVFGPSSWDTWAPGADEAVIKRVTDELNKGFMEENPEVTEIIHDARGTVDGGLSRLMNSQMAEEQIDLIMAAANPLNTSYQEKGLVKPLDDLVPQVEDRLVEGALDPFTIGGKVWGIPISSVSTTTFYYNKTLFDELSLNEPKTYDEFLMISEALRENGVKPVLHQGKNPWMWPMWYMSAFAQVTDNNEAEKTKSNLRGDTKFTDKEDVRAMELFRKFFDDGILDESSMDLDEETTRSLFITGKTATYFGGTWDIPILRENIKDFELGIFKFPQFTDEPGHPVGFGGMEVGLSISSRISDENLEAAKKYIEYASRPENTKLLLEPLDPVATSHKDVLGLDDPISIKIRDEYLPSSMFLDWLWPRELADTIQRQTQLVAGGSVTPMKAMENIQDKYDEMVKSGYEYSY